MKDRSKSCTKEDNGRHSSLSSKMSIYNKPRDKVISCLQDLSTVTEDSIPPGSNVLRAIAVLDRFQKDINSNLLPTHLQQYSSIYQKAAVLLYAMMDFAPIMSAREKVATHIVECGSSIGGQNMAHESLLELATEYCNILLLPLRNSRGKAPITSTSSSLQSTNADNDVLEANSTPAKRFNPRNKALERDCYRCLVSGILDTNRFEKDMKETAVVHTQATHIIPRYLSRPDGPPCAGTDPNKVDRSAAFWEIVSWFGAVDSQQLDGTKIDQLNNILTLSVSAHPFFDELKLWFEEKSPNCYEIHTIHKVFKASVLALKEIRFTTPDADAMPIPNSSYLRLHAACAKIAHMSGISEVMDQWDRDMDEMDALASDGSSMPLLASRLAVYSEPAFASK